LASFCFGGAAEAPVPFFLDIILYFMRAILGVDMLLVDSHNTVFQHQRIVPFSQTFII
jgi:hypothetical protein